MFISLLFACAAATQVVNIPLAGGIVSDGEFWAPLALGTPPQNFKLQIDTGSADLLVYSVGCVGCGNQAEYNPSKSSTGDRVPCNDPVFNCRLSGCSDGYCDFDDMYGDGSHVSGKVYMDLFTIGDLKANISFGNIENSSVNFEPNGVDGIWGLAWYTISDWNGTSAFQNVVNQLGLMDRFAMCLTSNPVMQLGGPLSDTGIQYTPVVQKSYYVVKMLDLQVNGDSIGVKPGVWNSGPPGCIVDSGTTLFLMPTVAYNTLFKAFQGVCSTTTLPGVCGLTINKSIFAGGGAQKCVKMTQAQINSFPQVSVVLDGTNPLTIDGNAYLLPISDGCYTMGIAESGPAGTILGDVFMQNFMTVFDRTNMKVGFGDLSLCPSPDRSSPVHLTL